MNHNNLSINNQMVYISPIITITNKTSNRVGRKNKRIRVGPQQIYG
jgi:hypothetical protein